jgi:hypothetical protein
VIHGKATLSESLCYKGGELQIIFHQQETHGNYLFMSD